MDKEDFKLFYDKQPDYLGFRNDPEKQEDYKILVDWKVRKLVSLVPGDLVFNNILEVGCAFGILLNNISERLNIGTRIGIDISGENIKLAKTLFPDCIFYHGTLQDFIKEELPLLKDHKIDLIVLSDIVEHVPDDLGFLKLMKGIAPYVLLNLPLERSFKNRNHGYGENNLSGHLRSYDKKLAEKLIRDSGFKIASSFTSIATSDKSFLKVYGKNRSKRVSAKPFYLKVFWSVFYAFEDKFKFLSKDLAGYIYGTNYFALIQNKTGYNMTDLK